MSAAWRAAVAAAARAPLRGRLAGMRPPRSQRRPPAWGAVAATALVGGGCLVVCYSGRPRVIPTVLAQKEDVIHAEVDERLSLRKHRFMHFASLEYEGEYYMTPRDFLFSVIFDQVERRQTQYLVKILSGCVEFGKFIPATKVSDNKKDAEVSLDGLQAVGKEKLKRQERPVFTYQPIKSLKIF